MPWEDLEERFRSKVRVAGDDECWIWTGRRHPFGYGEYGVKNPAKADHDKVRAHRYVFERLVGPIPLGLFVCHRCDVPACVNPKHLFLTTHEGNVRDCVRKGRQAAGESNGGAKLQRSQAEMIMRLYDEMRVSQRYLARLYGVTQMVISKIVRGETWRPRPLGLE
jgi:hypothetical protein